MLVAAMVIKMLGEGKPETITFKLSKSLFLPHGEVLWLVNYTVQENDQEELKIETHPYCKKCKVRFEYTSSDLETLRNLKCPSCGNIKRGYPLSTNYHSVQNFAQARIKEFKKQLFR